MDTAKETEQINQVCETAQRGLADEGSQGDTGCCDLSRHRQTGINLRPSRSREPAQDALATIAIYSIAWSHNRLYCQYGIQLRVYKQKNKDQMVRMQ